MFRKTKGASAVSGSRFCVTPIELPYAQLYRYHEFTVAISKLSRLSAWPQGRGLYDASAYGLLHGNHTYPDAEEPLLPVHVTFREDRLHPERLGEAHLDRSTRDGAYVLNVLINDPDGHIVAAVEKAMRDAVISGFTFMHLRCQKARDIDLTNARPSVDFVADSNADHAFLKKVEAGEAELETMVFDNLLFDDDLTTRAPAWSWDWRGWDFDGARFKNEKTASWRRQRLQFEGY